MTRWPGRLWKKMFGGRDRGPRKQKWHPWYSNVGVALVRARLEGRWKEKEVAA